MRSRRWLVEAVDAGAPPASPRVSLACADDDAQGRTLEVYWDFEIDRRILEQEAWTSIGSRGFDPPRHFSAFLHTLRWSCVTATDPNLFQSPFRAGIKMDAYQMEPLRKALHMPRVNLFHRRRHRPRQDHRSRPHRPGAAASQEGENDRRRRARVRAGAVEGGEGRALRPPLRDPGPGLARAGPPGAGLRGQPLAYPTAAFSSRTTCSSTRPTRTPCASGWARCNRAAS